MAKKAGLSSTSACFMDNFEACNARQHIPIIHRRAIRTASLIERPLVEERRGLKIIPNVIGEKSVLKLVFGKMMRGAARYRAIQASEFERRQMRAIGDE